MMSIGRTEHEIMRIKKHWMFFFWPVVLLPCTGGLSIFWFAYRLIIYWTDEFIITNQKVHISRGIISKDAHSIPLQKLNDLNYTQGVIGRFLGYGTVFLGSGNMASTDGFSYIANPARVKAVIEDALENQHDDRNRRLAGYIGDEIRSITHGQ
jgi:uncharacterized membrane protein YdbT with pleckstrin-like domain